MFLIVPAFETSPSAPASQRDLRSAEPTMPVSVQGASRMALLAAKFLLAMAFVVGLVSTIAAAGI
ncbi:MAG: hypothetical protein WB663_12615 [Beijerinckiaceae bacterium]|jgi:hypothetical protein